MTTESMWEDAQERFDMDPWESLLFDKRGLGDFVEWLSNEKPELADKLLAEWRGTKTGKMFEERAIQSIVEDLSSRGTEPEDDWRKDR